MKKIPDFSFEESFWRQGIGTVAGIDEVGRGSLAGPVVAAAAVMIRIKNHELRIKNILDLGIDDSKRLSAGKRRALANIIPKYFNCAIGQASVEEINCVGIVRATGRAMRRAIIRIMNYELRIKNGDSLFLLVDGYKMKYLPGGLARQLNIIKGDQKSVSIAAASIMAKVYRDTLMKRLGRRYPVYKWGSNKGYGTKWHLKALGKYGCCVLHRSIFRLPVT